MAVISSNIQKDGLDRIVKLGKALCIIVASFSAILIRKYPDNTLIGELLAAIAAVCALLPDIEAEFLRDIPNDPDLIDLPLTTAGINNSLPPAPDPSIV